MAVTYEWSFPELHVIYNQTNPETGEVFQNVVTTVHWIYTSRDGDYSASMYGTVGLPSPGQPFKLYKDLTPAIVQGWVESALSLDQLTDMKLSLANNIAEQKQPKGGNMLPPWK